MIPPCVSDLIGSQQIHFFGQCWKLLKDLTEKLTENSEYFENRLNI